MVKTPTRRQSLGHSARNFRRRTGYAKGWLKYMMSGDPADLQPWLHYAVSGDPKFLAKQVPPWKRLKLLLEGMDNDETD